MDEGDAKTYLASIRGRNPSEIGEVIDILYRKYRSYQKIADETPHSSDFLSSRHRIFQLPKGIRWQVDEGRITIGQGVQIASLKSEEDQWLLAFVLVETKQKFNQKECNNIIKKVNKENISMRNLLATSFGVRFNIIPLMLPFGFDERFAVTRAAWNKHKTLADFCLHSIRAGTDIDLEEEANQLESKAANFRAAGRRNADKAQQ